VRIGTLQLGSLKPGEWRPLTQGEIDALKGNAPAPSRETRDPRVRKKAAPGRGGAGGRRSGVAPKRKSR
jgi:hypothetical protein